MFEDHTLKEHVSSASSTPFPFTFLFSCLPVVHTSIYLFVGSWFIMPIFVWEKMYYPQGQAYQPLLLSGPSDELSYRFLVALI